MSNLNLFAQIITKLSRPAFKKIVQEKGTDKHHKGCDSWTHLICMLFCQFANCQSVRDISNGLRSATGNLNHLGIQTAPSKSTISYQNQRRDWTIFEAYYHELQTHLSHLSGFKKRRFRIKSKILLLDATLITLCLSVFDWAKYKTNKGAVKLHTLLDYDGNLPVYVNITDGKVADNKGAYDIPLEKGSVIVADRYYIDLELLNKWDSNQVRFVVRHKNNMRFEVIKEFTLNKEKYPHILKDELIVFTGHKSRKRYAKQLRRVEVWDEKNQKVIKVITNQISWTANTISELYKSRWEIEIFFREIKGLLHIKSFIGTSENAVRIQIWTALITILILKFLKAGAKYNWHLSNMVTFIRLNLFVKIDLHLWLNKPFRQTPIKSKMVVQGDLFG